MVFATLLPAAPALPQGLADPQPDSLCNRYEDRIWGRVTANGGQSHEGFLHFLGSRGGATRADPLLGRREVPDDSYQLWLEAARDGVPHLGVVEVGGYRVTWEERYPEFAQRSRASIRLGHVASLTPDGEGIVVVSPWGLDGEPRGDTATSAGRVGLRTEAPWPDDEVRIENADSQVTMRWKEITRIDFSPAPAGDSGRVAPRPLHGTAVDTAGRSYTGWVSWGAVRLESDSLGKIIMRSDSVSDSALQSIAHSEIARREGVATVERTGTTTRSVDPGSVRVAAPKLGVVEIPFGALRSLRLAAGGPSEGASSPWIISREHRERRSAPLARRDEGLVAALPAQGATQSGATGVGIVNHGLHNVNQTLQFEETSEAVQRGCSAARMPWEVCPRAVRCEWHRSWPLAGTVTTSGGEEIEGRIRWNALKEWSWELLEGSSRGVDFLVAFAEIELMERDPKGGLRVSLADGRMLHLTDGGDVDEGNRGVLVFPTVAEAGGSWQGPSSGWRHVAWSEIGEVRLRHQGSGELGR